MPTGKTKRRPDDALLGSTSAALSLLSDTITDPEIATVYNVSLATVRRWAALGRLPPKLPAPGRTSRRNLAAVKRALGGDGVAA